MESPREGDKNRESERARERERERERRKAREKEREKERAHGAMISIIRVCVHVSGGEDRVLWRQMRPTSVTIRPIRPSYALLFLLQDLLDATGQTSVPSGWVKGAYIGGCNDGPEPWMGIVPCINSGKIKEMMA